MAQIDPLIIETITLGVNGSVEKSFQARSFLILEVAGNINLSFDQYDEFQAAPGYSFTLPEGENTLRLFAIDKGAAGGSVKVAYSMGVVEYRSFQIGNIVAVRSGGILATPLAVTVNDSATALVTSSATRTRVVVQNNGVNPFFVGDANVAPASNRGLKLNPGDTFTASNGAALFGRCSAGLSSTASIMTEAQ